MKKVELKYLKQVHVDENIDKQAYYMSVFIHSWLEPTTTVWDCDVGCNQ